MERLTSNAGEELACKLLDVTAGEGHKRVALQEIKDTLAEEVGDDTDVVSEVESVPQMNTLVAVVLVVLCQS